MKQACCMLSILLFSLAPASSQPLSFTRITSPLNPVVSDTDRSGGGSWVDVDNDDDLDLFVSNGNAAPQNNRLYVNTGGGAFTKVTTGSFVTDGGASIGSTWGDYDNDGFPDCFVTNRFNGGNFLYRGNGTANPVRQAGIAPVTDIANSNMGSWVDIDSDGDLDLSVVNFGGNDFLYLNSGAAAYSFSTNQSHPIQLDSAAFSITGLWADYNNDRRPDLFVGNSGSQDDKLYTNRGSLGFTVTTLADGKASLGGSWGDYDNDGDLDLFVANYLNQPCILYRNSGAPAYILTADTTTAVRVAGSSVGSAFGDLDNDGDQDLIIADDGGNERLFLNSGFPDYSFTADTSTPVTKDGGNSFGCTLGDYDGDGSLDVFVANLRSQKNFLYHNDGNANRWITIRCVGTASNRAAIGAKVFAKAVIGGAAIWQMQEVMALSGYNSQNLWLHFGFGADTAIDSLVIRWPSGWTDTCAGVPTNMFYTAVEGITCKLPALPSLSGAAPLMPCSEIRLVITPNPVQDRIVFELVNPKREIIRELVIKNSIGATAARIPVNSSAASIRLSDGVGRLALAPGVYFAAVAGITRMFVVP